MKRPGSILCAIVVFSTLFAVVSNAEDGSNPGARSRLKRTFNGITISPNTKLIKPDFVDEQVFDGLSEDQIKTLQSIRLIEGSRTYVMTYYGSYGTADDITAHPYEAPFEQDQRISCSTFSAATPQGEPIFAYNNDIWTADWMLVIFADPPDGYATMCISSTRFCGIRQYAQDYDNLSLRDFILTAPQYSFDGINEYGVTMSPMDNGDGVRVFNPRKKSLHGLTTICLVLHSARNVYEAIDLLRRYNNTFSDQIHYLLSDAYGNSVVIEYYDDQVVPTWKSGPFQICTNNRVNGYQNDASHWMVPCDRYWKLLSWLSACNGIVTEEKAFDFLAGVARQPTSDSSATRTVWSSVYNNIAGTWKLVFDCKYDEVYEFSMPMITNLAVGSVKLLTKSQTPRIGGKVRLYAKVRNAGIRPTVATKVVFYLSKSKKVTGDSVLLGSCDLKSLAAGKKKGIRASANLPAEIKPGRYYIIACVDPDGDGNEENTENNVLTSKSKYRIK
jgi:hypothetical protein